MKKHTRKLVLTQHTVRSLTDGRLGHVVGGFGVNRGPCTERDSTCGGATAIQGYTYDCADQ